MASVQKWRSQAQKAEAAGRRLAHGFYRTSIRGYITGVGIATLWLMPSFSDQTKPGRKRASGDSERL